MALSACTLFCMLFCMLVCMLVGSKPSTCVSAMSALLLLFTHCPHAAGPQAALASVGDGVCELPVGWHICWYAHQR